MPERGLTAGYDDEKQEYETIDYRGSEGCMPNAQLGKREIPILAVTVPDKPTGESLYTLAPRTLSMAICHAYGLEISWGNATSLAAYPAWAALIKSVDQTSFHSQYYAGIYAHLRSCAAAYLYYLAAHNSKFTPAAEAYASIATQLKAVSDARNDPSFPTAARLEQMESANLSAYEMDKKGVLELKNCFCESVG